MIFNDNVNSFDPVHFDLHFTSEMTLELINYCWWGQLNNFKVEQCTLTAQLPILIWEFQFANLHIVPLILGPVESGSNQFDWRHKEMSVHDKPTITKFM